MKNWLRSWFGIRQDGKRRSSRPKGVRPRVRLHIEALEDRSLPSAAPLVAASYFDSALYALDSVNGALLNTLVAPNSQATLSGAAGLTVGPDGNLYLSSQNNDSIVQFNMATQSLTTFIDSSVLGPIATANGDAQFAPAGLRFGPDGNLYVSLNGGQSATSGGAVVRFDIAATNSGLSYAGTATTIATGLTQPTELTFGVAPADLDSLYVSNSGAGNVIKIPHAVAASPSHSEFIAAGSGGLNYPSGLTWHGGKLYVVDLGATTNVGQVLRYNANGTFNAVFTKPASALTGQFPSDAVFNSLGQLLTADLGPTYPVAFGGPGTSGGIAKFNVNGVFLRTMTSTSFPADAVTGVTNFSPSQLTLFAGNSAPTASAGTFYNIDQGSSLALHAFAADPDGDTLRYSWDVNGDGVFGDATGANPVLGTLRLQNLGVYGNGSFSVRVMVADGHGHVVTSAPVSLTVNYVAPTVAPLTIASYFDNAVYEVSASTGKLLNALVLTNSQSTLSGPAGLTIGPAGTLYLSGRHQNSTVR